MTNIEQKVLLVILDGFGLSSQTKGNAILSAKTPFLDTLSTQIKPMALNAASEYVGLPWGVMGNSEVGHMIIGGGRVILQDYTQIDNSIQDKTFFKNEAFVKAIENSQKNHTTLHILGLISKSGVHGHLDHMIALLKLAQEHKVDKVAIHAITDGRDAPPKSSPTYLEELQKAIDEFGIGRVATLVGRFYAMDRDRNQDRTKVAFDALTKNNEPVSNLSPLETVKTAYDQGENDEDLKPIILDKDLRIKPGDSVIMTNFRPDRAIQLAKALAQIGNLQLTTLTNYEDSNLNAQVAFSDLALSDPKSNPLTNPLGQVIDKADLTQLRIAETEKMAHITYFFDLGRTEPWSNKDQRIMIPSLKVKSFNQAPEMSAHKIVQEIISALPKNYAFIAVNLANADMVAHTGDNKATIQAVEYLDKELADFVPKATQAGYTVLITADHGNAEEIEDIKGNMNKEHSINPVPLWIIPMNYELRIMNYELKEPKTWLSTQPIGILADIAPTILHILNIQPPSEMTGVNLSH